MSVGLFPLKFNVASFEFPSGPDARRAELIELAKSAEAADRFEDMCACMRELAKEFGKGGQLTLDERNLLSVAYKNVIGSRRNAWRSLMGLAENKNTAIYRSTLVEEIESIAHDLLQLLDQTLLVGCSDDATKVFFVKLTADYYRYLAECNKTDEYVSKASDNYKLAAELASTALPSADPIRLGVALNYSVCMYELLGNTVDACALARAAFDSAIGDLDSLPEDVYKDSTLILQLLRDNLSLWTSGQDNEADRAEAGAGDE